MRILIVEDDKIVRTTVKKSLLKEGFDIIDTGNPVEALKILKEEQFDLILLDLILPEIDGYSFCEIVKTFPSKYGNPAIIMLTSKDSVDSVLKGLEFGADDYVKKPFDQKELTARIKAVLRRGKTPKKKKIVYGDLILDIETENLSDSSARVYELYKMEYELLKYLFLNQGIVLSREKIYQEIWHDEYIQGNRAVDNYMWKLKKKIEILNDKIKSCRGRGYILEKI